MKEEKNNPISMQKYAQYARRQAYKKEK